MSGHYDVVIIGAGHNGLTAAAYLARAGRAVLVLERREVIGGAAVTEEFCPGYRVDSYAHRLGALDPRVLRDLRLPTYGLEIVRPDPGRTALTDGRALSLFAHVRRTAENIRAFSAADAERWPAFCARIADAMRIVAALREREPPRLPSPPLSEMFRLGVLGFRLRRLGRRAMVEAMRIVPMSVAELVEEWFQSDVLRGAIAGVALIGLPHGPHAAGTVYALLHHQAEGDGPAGGVALVRGGMGRLTQALAAAARAAGVEIRTAAAVQRIVTRSGVATGTVLANGDEVSAKCVLASVDPRRAFLQLVGAESLDPAFVRQVSHIRMRGACAKVHLALGELPRFPGLATGDAHLKGAITIAPSLGYLERAADAAKYGQVSQHPFLEAVIPTLTDPSLAPPGHHVMSVLAQYAPYQLASGTWDGARRDALGDAVVATLAQYAPDLPKAIVRRQVLSPLDLEQGLGLTEGNIFHGEMALDQLSFMRPVPGWAYYRTPIQGLYLCGAGAHPGGGVTAAPGYHAARAVLRDQSAS